MTLVKRAFLSAFLCALVMAAASTAGDLIWALWIPSHRVFYGVAHGVLLCWVLGVTLGFVAGGRGAWWKGGLGALAVGLISSGSYYVLAPFLRVWAMFAAWCVLWILVALLLHWIGRKSLGRFVLPAGLAASAFSGLGFYAISGIWLHSQPDGPNYAYNFVCWTVAFFPGFFPLFLFHHKSEP